MLQDVTLVGLDLGKHSFHLHGQDRRGKGVFRKKLSRKQLVAFFATFHACTIVMEACAGSHPMARKLAALGIRLSSSHRSSCGPSSRVTRTTSWIPRRFARRLRTRPCGS